MPVDARRLKLRDWRTFRALSQQELADAAGIQRGTVIDIESGRRVPQPRTLRRLAEALSVAPSKLYQTPSEND